MIHLFLFASGAAALIYEVVWSRQLATFLGITTHAHTVVVATFMLGFAAGSRVLGRVADRSADPRRLFGQLEAGIGLYGLAAIWLLPLLERLYAGAAHLGPGAAAGPAAHLLRFVLAAGALFLPTFLMGGTVPAVVRALGARRSKLANSLAAVYGTNTLGAAAGAAGAGYVLLPTLGVRATVLVAAALNLLAAAVYLWPRRSPERRAPGSTVTPPRPAAGRARVLVLLAFSGFAGLALQLGWVRALTLVIGSSVYAFSLTLATYLVGLAIGSFAAGLILAPRSRPPDRRRLLRHGSILAAVTGFSSALGLLVIGRLPELFLGGYRMGFHQDFARLQLFLFLLAAAVVLIPTSCLGALFPLLTAAASRDDATVGSDVGGAYAANSAGTVLGVMATGLVLLPTIGVHHTILLAAGLQVLVAAALWGTDRLASERRVNTLALQTSLLGLFFVVAAALPAWDRAVMTSGPFINFSRIADVPEGEAFRDWIRRRNRLLFYDEGADGNVAVRQFGDERLLVINGKTDGSRLGDRKTQLTISHLPLLMHERPKRALMIGLGTGMSAAAAAAHPVLETIDVLEISPEVVAASQFFVEDNDSVLEDPRLDLVLADARSFLHTTDRLYDVIIAEPSNPWITGVANLFTREFFLLALRRLEVNGVMSQWFHTYGMSHQDLLTTLATFQDVFPSVSVWVPQIGDLVLIGSRTPHYLRGGRIEELLTEPAALAGLLSVDLTTTADFARMYLLGGDELRRLVGTAPLNTDNHPRVEFNAPRFLYSETATPNMNRLVAHLAGQSQTVPITGLRRDRADGPQISAFGISVRLEPDAPAGAEWRVLWSAPESAEPEKLPRFAVGSRRLVVLPDAEITCGYAEREPDQAALLDYAQALVERPATTGTIQLADGKRAVWALGAANREGPRPWSLVWSCGHDGSGWTRYAAAPSLAPTLSSTVPGPVAVLAARISCVG